MSPDARPLEIDLSEALPRPMVGRYIIAGVIFVAGIALPFGLWALLEEVAPWIPYDVLRLGAVTLAFFWIYLLLGLFWVFVARSEVLDVLGEGPALSRHISERLFVPYGIRASEVMRALDAEQRRAKAPATAVVPVFGNKDARRQLLFAFICLPGGVAFLVVAFMGYLGENMIGAAFIGFVAIWPSAYFGVKAARSLAVTADEVRRSDRRPPVLLLRSFRVEGLRLAKRNDFYAVTFHARFEAELVKWLAKIGPCIAIGIPGEKLLPLGAARSYPSETEWQQAVVKTMEEAATIVVIAGETEWLKWELDQIVERRHLHKCIILFPPRPQGTVADPAADDPIHNSIGGTIWETSVGSVPADVVGLYVRNDGHALLIRSKSHFIHTYELALLAAYHAMRRRDVAAR